MAEFFSSRLLRWLIVPYRSRLVNFASKPFYQVADRILGTQFLEDIAQFFILFQSMYDGFVERARAVHRLMADRRTSFIVVSTLEAVPLREAEFFAQALKDRRLHLGAIVLNKVLPAYLRDPQGAAVAERLRDRADELAEAVAPKVRTGDVSPDPPGAGRGGPELPRLPGRGPARGRAAGGAGHGARGPRERAVLRDRRLRPRRPAAPGRAAVEPVTPVGPKPHARG